MSGGNWSKLTLVALLLSFLLPRQVWAEADRVRIAQPYGLLYLPSYVVVDRHMIEERAAAAGLGPIKVTLTRLASGPAGSDMILAGDADLAMGGFGPALTLWDKTRGAQKVRGMMPLCSSPMFLTSTDPRIHSLKDFTDKDRIAVSAIKVTDQAITLEMAAAKEWGWDQRFRLDSLTVAMSNPDGQAALLGGLSEVRNHATIIPFSIAELESGKAHLVMTSDDVMRPGATSVVVYASAHFHDPNPKLYAATAQAFEDAIDWINANPHEAAQIYLARESRKEGVDWIERMIRDPARVSYSATPRGMQEHADFMHEVGTLKNKTDSWKDLFWENMATKDGN
ncbi:MAG: sulfonate transport system substrate-binding protein [Acetobacteraceae bacterium]|jgi:NitT/TauT family transport system substrate-binding protein|nr:sulfonate transport system substrate-binding protein [Acetobacteraceae bacterium]